MKPRWVVIGGVVGTVLGAAVAYLGATRAFTCNDNFSFEAACAGPNVVLALLWGVPIGLVVGLLFGFLLSRRLGSKGHISDPSSEPRM